MSGVGECGCVSVKRDLEDSCVPGGRTWASVRADGDRWQGRDGAGGDGAGAAGEGHHVLGDQGSGPRSGRVQGEGQTGGRSGLAPPGTHPQMPRRRERQGRGRASGGAGVHFSPRGPAGSGPCCAPRVVPSARPRVVAPFPGGSAPPAALPSPSPPDPGARRRSTPTARMPIPS